MMLGEQQPVQTKLKALIQSINEFEHEISTPYDAKRSNLKTSILLKIPKYLLLTKILPYLTNRECQYLSNVSVFIRRSVYSPLGWKVMGEMYSPYDTIVVDEGLLSKNRMKKVMSAYSSEVEDNLEDYEDEQFLVKERARYKQVLWTKYKQFLSMREKNEVLGEKLRCEKMFLFRTKLKKTFYQRQCHDLESENTKFKEKLKKMTTNFLSRDEKLAKRIEEIQGENLKLQRQKEALVLKIKQYQEEMPRVVEKAEGSKRTLGMLKEFLLEREFEPLEDVVE